MRKIAAVFILLLGAGVLAWYFFFFDRLITEGEAYGFNIGMLKSDAIGVIQEQYGSIDNELILSPSLHGNDVDSIIYISANKINSDIVKHKNVWQLRFYGKETNVLVLVFDESGLVNMLRYRRAFIL